MFNGATPATVGATGTSRNSVGFLPSELLLLLKFDFHSRTHTYVLYSVGLMPPRTVTIMHPEAVYRRCQLKESRERFNVNVIALSVAFTIVLEYYLELPSK